MKKCIFKPLIFSLCLFFYQYSTGEKLKDIPAVSIKNLDLSTFNTANINNNNKPIVISFWATWCSPCKRELNAIAEVYENWEEETGVKLIAISIDDSRNMNKVAPYVYGQDWPFDVYIDVNSDLRRAMNVNNVPHTFLIDKAGNIVYQHNSYSPGDEDKLFEEIKKINTL